MLSTRNQLLQWAAEKKILRADLPAAMRVAGVYPNTAEWTRLFDALSLWLGSLLVAVGVIFFFAYNWNELGRLAKFALVQGPLLATITIAIWKGVDSDIGRAAMLVASLLVGALLALIGQTYQTGADPWQLFASWAVLVLPWTVVVRMPALWIIWLALVNISLSLYYATFGGLFGILFSGNEIAWVLLTVNLIALVTWQTIIAKAPGALRARWALRVLATACGVLITTLVLYGIFNGEQRIPAAVVWVAMLWATHAYYRSTNPDLFMLAGGVLSAVFVMTAALSRALLNSLVESAGALLVVGLLVIGLSAGGAWWLRTVASELDER